MASIKPSCSTCIHATDEGDRWKFQVPVGSTEEQLMEPGLWCTLRPSWDQVTRRHWCASWQP